MTFDLKTSEVVASVVEKSARKVMLQLPDGLKRYGLEVAETVEKETGATVYLSADPCYGACDLPTEEAKRLGVDLIVHYGHTPFTKQITSNIIYVPVKAKVELSEVVEKALHLLAGYSNIGLITTLQHVGDLKLVEAMLRKCGKEVRIGQPGDHAEYPGQVTGCDYTAAKTIEQSVDAYLYIGGGIFHALGVALAVKQPVIIADPYLGEVRDLTALRQKVINQRKAAIRRLVQARIVGVIVGTKTGQFNCDNAEVIRKELTTHGKKVTLLTMREITPEAIDNFPDIDVFINTACPRVGVDDPERYTRPIISYAEVLEAFKSGWTVTRCSQSGKSLNSSSQE
ncbi:MAG: diphthamide biosynthesis enzyme Dph2 [Candidatus Bathyarchaeia archaeon]